MRHRPFTLFAILALASACKMSHEDARADSVRTAEQLQLTNRLAAQKDSLVSVVLDADKFISHRSAERTARVRSKTNSLPGATCCFASTRS